MVGNNAVNRVDVLGLMPRIVIDPSRWTACDCAELAKQIVNIIETLPEIERMYAERVAVFSSLGGSVSDNALVANSLLSLGAGATTTAEAYREIYRASGKVPLLANNQFLSNPSVAKAPFLSPAYMQGVKVLGQVTTGIGLAVSMSQVLDSSLSPGKRLVASIDTAVGGATLYPFKDPFTGAVVGAAGAGYFAGRFIGDATADDPEYDQWAKLYHEADLFRQRSYQELEQLQKSFQEHCR